MLPSLLLLCSTNRIARVIDRALIGSLVSLIRDVKLSLQAVWLDFPVGRRAEVRRVLSGQPGQVPRVRKAVIGP
jgi:hypothetical protein